MKQLLATLLFAMLMMGVSAQTANDPVVFEIGGKPILKSQLMKEFLQSIGKDPAAAPTACTYEKRKALEDYVDLYVNFRTKLADAYSMGFDTTKSLRDELAMYRKELAAPYLIDSATQQSILREAYDRNHYALHAAHILVPCDEAASPEDTLKAYQHAMELYEQALTADDFYNRQLGTLFETMVELDREGSAVDVVTLQNRLKEKNTTLQYELQKLLSSLTQLNPSTTSEGKTENMTTEIQVRAAATIATMLPIICLYPFLQRYFVTGLTIGGVKE